MLREYAITYLTRKHLTPLTDFDHKGDFDELMRIYEIAAVALYQRKHNINPQQEPQRAKWFDDTYARYWELHNRLLPVLQWLQ